VDGFWNHAADIIGVAGKSPLNLIALALLCSMAFAYVFFRASANWVKLSTYLGLLLFLGVAVIAMAVISVMSSVMVQQPAQSNRQLVGYTPAPLPDPQPAQPIPTTAQRSGSGMAGLAGLYNGRARNGNIYGNISILFASVGPTGAMQLKLSESGSLQGSCILSGAIQPTGRTDAFGACQDNYGSYDSEVHGQFVDATRVQGHIFWYPRPGTPAPQQMEEFDVHR
jgi:hypothetical protein